MRVFDASAVMAVLRGENGAEALYDLLPDAVVSSVNVAEVHTKLVQAGTEEATAWTLIKELQLPAIRSTAFGQRLCGISP